MENEESESNRMLLWTRIIAIAAVTTGVAAIITTILSGIYSQKQVNELSKATELSWRPFLNINHTSNYLEYGLWALPTANVDTVKIGLNDLQYSKIDQLYFRDEKQRYFKDKMAYQVKRGSESTLFTRAELLKSDYLSFHWTRKVIYNNVGNTPLRVVGILPTAIYKEEWDSLFFKSTEKIFDFYKDNELITNYEVDYIVFPNSSDTTAIKGIRRNIPMSEFYDEFNANNCIVLYSVTVVLYEDFFGHSYNTVLIEHTNVEIKSNENELIFPEKSRIIIEGYSWDVGEH